MSTSGLTSYHQTKNELIQSALGKLGVYGVGRTVSAEDMAVMNANLNMIVKTHQADGLHLWAKEEAYLFPSTSTAIAAIDGSSAKIALKSDTVLANLTAAAVTSATTLALVSTGMAIGDYIGVVLDDGTAHWTTIATVPNAASVTITSGLASAAASGNNVYTFTTKLNKPLRVLGMRRVTGISSPSSIPMLQLSHQEYFDLPNKSLSGLPSHFYYEPKLSSGNLYLWPTSNSPNTYFEVTFERQLEKFNAATDNPDFPDEWSEYLVYRLAAASAFEFGKSHLLQALQAEVDKLWDKVSSYDVESGSVSIMPDNYGR